MSLYSFIERRRKNLGMTQAELEERSSVSHMTLERIKANGTIMSGTKQNLALALQCSIGDLNAAIAEPVENDHPDVAAEPAKGNWIERDRGKGEWPELEETKQEQKIPVQPEADAQAVMAETEAYDAAEPDKVPDKETLEALFPDEEPEVKVLRENCKLIMQASRAARRSCREELKSMFLKAATQMVLGEDQLSDLYSDFGYTVVKWLAEEEAAEAQKAG